MNRIEQLEEQIRIAQENKDYEQWYQLCGKLLEVHAEKLGFVSLDDVRVK